ncbi:stage II sporulation protein R [Tepidibacter formicigenes]|jgi:stage II sporulation protein R|uniref:Stage II sporulation protein R n=1 Tax=Tepidibacter formicigenes DSM 15518 TaxID=1123349 RepID=A0A1M6SVH3_9FIRM|nr:stage II sporulation protein R [Tepidibacter formicigenes]SHK48705.1 stage II sporulation protein R [Tepidibacter formicigenes DSM 15518]
MKKITVILTISILIILSGVFYLQDIYKNRDAYKEKLIRFHVIANSDSKEDQDLKLKVRDKVIAYLSPKLENSKSIEETKEIIEANLKNIENIASTEIKNNNKDYKVSADLGYSNFPTKKYSNIVLPAGKYKAVKVIIGEGKGKNWWCVMFPPLCFIDINHGITDKKTKKNLTKVLTKEEYNMILVDNNEVKLKFKILEIIEKIKNKHTKYLAKNK